MMEPFLRLPNVGNHGHFFINRTNRQIYISNIWWPRRIRSHVPNQLFLFIANIEEHGIVGIKRVMRKLIVFFKNISLCKIWIPLVNLILQLFFVCLFVCLVSSSSGSSFRQSSRNAYMGGGGVGKRRREEIKGRSLVCVDSWVQKNILNRVLTPSHSSYPMRHAWGLSAESRWPAIYEASDSFLQVAFGFSSRRSSLAYYLWCFCKERQVCKNNTEDFSTPSYYSLHIWC